MSNFFKYKINDRPLVLFLRWSHGLFQIADGIVTLLSFGIINSSFTLWFARKIAKNRHE